MVAHFDRRDKEVKIATCASEEDAIEPAKAIRMEIETSIAQNNATRD